MTYHVLQIQFNFLETWLIKVKDQDQNLINHCDAYWKFLQIWFSYLGFRTWTFLEDCLSSSLSGRHKSSLSISLSGSSSEQDSWSDAIVDGKTVTKVISLATAVFWFHWYIFDLWLETRKDYKFLITSFNSLISFYVHIACTVCTQLYFLWTRNMFRRKKLTIWHTICREGFSSFYHIIIIILAFTFLIAISASAQLCFFYIYSGK